MTSRISCDAHDYYEIICMRCSKISVTTAKGEVLNGTALNIIIIEQQEVLQINDSDKIHHVVLTDIKKLQALNNKNSKHNFVVQW